VRSELSLTVGLVPRIPGLSQPAGNATTFVIWRGKISPQWRAPVARSLKSSIYLNARSNH
jgi:hypothetical protein